MMNLIYPGSFNPISLGHCDIIDRALQLPFEKLYIAILHNPLKINNFLTVEQRGEMIRDLYNFDSYPQIEVITSPLTLPKLAKELDCKHVVRGIRGVTDLASEMELAYTYADLSAGNIETIFLMTSLQNTYTSSTRIREYINYGENVRHLIPPRVATWLERYEKILPLKEGI